MKPKQYQIGMDTFKRMEVNCTLEERLLFAKGNIDKYTWRNKGQDRKDFEKIIAYAKWALEQINKQEIDPIIANPPYAKDVTQNMDKDDEDSPVVNADTIKDVMSKLMKKKKEIDEKMAGNFDTHEKLAGGFVSHKPESIINKHNKLEMIEQLESLRLGVREWAQQSTNNRKPKKRINRVFAIDKKKFDRGISERFKKMNGFSDPTIA